MHWQQRWSQLWVFQFISHQSYIQTSHVGLRLATSCYWLETLDSHLSVIALLSHFFPFNLLPSLTLEEDSYILVLKLGKSASILQLENQPYCVFFQVSCVWETHPSHEGERNIFSNIFCDKAYSHLCISNILKLTVRSIFGTMYIIPVHFAFQIF